MSKKLFRATRNPAFIETALKKSKHVVTKAEDGTFYCEVHACAADLCSPRPTSDTIWSSELDGGKYVVAVVRLEPYHGELTVERDGQRILQRDVVISFDAPFGPDGEDVMEWQRMGIEAADTDYVQRGEFPPP